MTVMDMYGQLGCSPEMLLGKPTLHLPLNLICQRVDPESDRVAGVFQTTQGAQLLFGSEKTHQLILGDVFVRPRLVCESDHLQGTGMMNLATRGFTPDSVEEWRKGVLFHRT